jgi:hypothetical protein
LRSGLKGCHTVGLRFWITFIHCSVDCLDRVAGRYDTTTGGIGKY